jgi:alcohol dehydrogenase
MLSLMAEGRLDPQRLVTRTLHLDEAPAALERMGIDPQPGVSIIRP